MTQGTSGEDLVEEVTERLERAADADDEARAELLDDLCASLEQELETEQTPAARR